MSINTNDLADLAEIDRFEESIKAFNAGELDTDRMTAIRLQHGVYGQRQQGVNMLRMKVPGGRLTPDQLDAVADLTDNYSERKIAHATTRQSIQVHFIKLVDMPNAMRRLAEVGMTSREACSHTVRNMSACGLAGVCPREHVDISTHLDGATVHFLRNPLNQQMPRKFKMSFSGCESDCAQSLLHDAGVVAVKKDGKHGFMVKAGGGLGHKPREAIVVEEFIQEDELLFSIEALLTLHNKHSDRKRRAKSRIKFLVERFGVEGFLEKYREEFERTKQALATSTPPKGEWRDQTESEIPGPGAPRKLFAQRQAGLFAFPVALPLGDMKPEQMHGIASLMRDHGLDEIHTTQDQNLVLMNVKQQQIDSVREAFAALGLKEPAASDDVVACPGTSTCRLGITASTIVAPELSGGKNDLRIRVSGCHNGCAQPETGDIGIYGEGKRKHGKLVPHYQMYFGGSGMGGGKLAIKGPAVPVMRVKQAIERVEQAHDNSGEASFFDWAHAQGASYFSELLADLVEVSEQERDSLMQDYGSTESFRVINMGGGECAGVSQVMIGAQFFEAAHERHYRTALAFQRKYDEASHCNESILELIGNGLIQLENSKAKHIADLSEVAAQLTEKVGGQVAADFDAIVKGIPQEASLESLEDCNKLVDAWMKQAAALATAKDPQLDLSEALPN